jgi:hypothetical protein
MYLEYRPGGVSGVERREKYVIEKHLEALLALGITSHSMPVNFDSGSSPVNFNSGSSLSRTGANVRLRPSRAT